MNPIERLQADLAGRFPNLMVQLDVPVSPRGSWFLDVRRPGDIPPVVVEWRPDRGFGVSTPGADDFGSGPDEVISTVEGVFDWFVRKMEGGDERSRALDELVRLGQEMGDYDLDDKEPAP